MKYLAALVLIVPLAACGGAPASTPTLAPTVVQSPTPTPTPQSRIVAASNACPRTLNEPADGGKSLFLDTKGTDDREGDPIEYVSCILGKLNTPDYVVRHIDSTRALDGQQIEEWDGIKARWTYHPDDGLQITLVDSEV